MCAFLLLFCTSFCFTTFIFFCECVYVCVKDLLWVKTGKNHQLHNTTYLHIYNSYLHEPFFPCFHFLSSILFFCQLFWFNLFFQGADDKINCSMNTSLYDVWRMYRYKLNFIKIPCITSENEKKHIDILASHSKLVNKAQ